MNGEPEANGREIAVIDPREHREDARALTLAQREQVAGMIRPVAPPSEVLAVQNETRQLIAQTLERGRDYGEIPGTNKPTLLKPGAERIGAAFGVYPRYEIVEREVDHDRAVEYTKKTKKWRNAHRGDREFTWSVEPGTSQGLYRYVIQCELVHRASGVVIGQGLGSCSTMESKYIDRPRDLENTVIKMAEKRALVGAVLNTFGLSDQFTQDVEDMAQDAPAEPPPSPLLASSEQVAELRALVKQCRELPRTLDAREQLAVDRADGMTDPAVNFTPPESKALAAIAHLKGIASAHVGIAQPPSQPATAAPASLDAMRKLYHATWGGHRTEGESSDEHDARRRDWQAEHMGEDQASTKSWAKSDYRRAIDMLSSGIGMEAGV